MFLGQPGQSIGTAQQGAVPPMSRAEEAEPLGRDSWDTWDIRGSDVDLIIYVLSAVVRRDLGAELTIALRVRLSRLHPAERSNLAAVIDDVFQVSPDSMTARERCSRVLDEPGELERVIGFWPKYPDFA
jgi:hypothetical protein